MVGGQLFYDNINSYCAIHHKLELVGVGLPFFFPFEVISFTALDSIRLLFRAERK